MLKRLFSNYRDAAWFGLVSATHLLFMSLLVMEIIPQDHSAAKVATGTVGVMVFIELYRGFRIRKDTSRFYSELQDAKDTINQATGELMEKMKDIRGMDQPD